MFPENRLLELMIIGAVALIVVGPKDLPVLMRRVGQFVGRMRGMANEFRASFEDLARQSELEDLRKEVEAMRADHRNLAQFNPAPSAYVPPDPAAPDFSAHAETAPEPAPVMTSIAPVTALEPAPAKAAPAEDAPPKPKTPRKPRAKKPESKAS
jgi:sec-independent protein translocase protein TatB